MPVDVRRAALIPFANRRPPGGVPTGQLTDRGTVVDYVGKTAVVVGRSMAGLAAGAALSKTFESVLIVDRDPAGADLDMRSGVGQGHHLHNLLKGGELSIERLLGGAIDALRSAGAVEVRQASETRFYDTGHWHPQRDLGFSILSATRWLIEKVVRDRLLQEPGVSIRHSSSLKEIVLDGDGSVKGVVISNPDGSSEELRADLVVDCTGRGSQLPAQLKALGIDGVPEFRINMGLSYTSALYEAPADALGGDASLVVIPRPPQKRGAFVSKVEGGRWMVSLHSRFEKQLPESEDEMLAFASASEVPDVADFLQQARLAGPIRTYRKPHATWRRFDKCERFPNGLLALGDSITSFNPVYGQGMSVAWLQAESLDEILRRRASESPGLDGLAAEYFPAAMNFSREAWNGSTLVDASYEEVTGDTPPGAEQSLVFLQALRTLLHDDADLHADYLGIAQMTTPAAALMTPERMARVMAAAASV